MKTNSINLPEPLSFEWDQWNESKILSKHGITSKECEEVFRSRIVSIFPDQFHSSNEDRHILIGETKNLRHLYIVFIIRNKIVRIISARYMHKKEIQLYEEETNSTEV